MTFFSNFGKYSTVGAGGAGGTQIEFAMWGGAGG